MQIVNPTIAVFQQLFALVFMHKSLFQATRSDGTGNIAKDAFYRFLNSCNINWRRFVHLLAGKVDTQPLTSGAREKTFATSKNR